MYGVSPGLEQSLWSEWSRVFDGEVLTEPPKGRKEKSDTIKTEVLVYSSSKLSKI